MDILDSSHSDVHCATCDKPPRSNAYLYRCHVCEKYFDKACGKFTTTVLDDSVTVRTCVACATRAKQSHGSVSEKTGLRRTNSMTHGHSGHYTTLNTSKSLDTSVKHQDSNTGLTAFMDEMRKMNIELQDQIKCVGTNVDKRLDDFSAKLKILDTIPDMVKRIEDTEAGLESVKLQLDALKTQLITAQETGLTSSLPSDVTGKINTLELQNATLVTKLQELSAGLKASRDGTSDHDTHGSLLRTDIVISGLAAREDTAVDLKLLAAAALKVVYPNLDKRDVISARCLTRRPTPTSTVSSRQVAASTSSSEPSVVGCVQQQRQTTESSLSAQSNSNPSTSIVVALSSRALLLEILRSKAKLGKLHTTACLPHLPTGLDANSLIPSLINIREFLPGPVFKVHSFVHRKARELRNSSKPGFIHFISKDKIYVRRMKGQPSVLITTEKDLEDFLVSSGLC